VHRHNLCRRWVLGAHVEQIDDNVGPKLWQWNYDGDKKESAAPAARMEQIVCNDDPEPPIGMIFHDSDEKKSAVLAARMELANDIRGPEPPMFSSEQAFLDNNFKNSSALIGGGKGLSVGSSNFETTNSFISFDSLEGENYFCNSINTTNTNKGRGDITTIKCWCVPQQCTCSRGCRFQCNFNYSFCCE
jgi:hypothetical protein